MKSAFFSMFLILSVVYCFAQLSNAAGSCGPVDMRAASCITFATGKVSTPPAACCSGLQELARGVKTVEDKKVICRCLKSGVKNFAGVQDRFLSQIPNACKIKVGFPVSLNTDCEK
ncbi:non-specific lipid-transfer protein c cotyledon-specific isoform [Phtheirospermum japonicum]|uniref:Non-specific lipid-transfer protein n=1 Tax=Phtheirospermum japonicum TaxID=374723 RepID=A0A830CNJ7_9LAMI|nr:non-specific lipid-transfer protein c cotyledon-specific isoform [Phtheirospermum japonicum]